MFLLYEIVGCLHFRGCNGNAICSCELTLLATHTHPSHSCAPSPAFEWLTASILKMTLLLVAFFQSYIYLWYKVGGKLKGFFHEAEVSGVV